MKHLYLLPAILLSFYCFSGFARQAAKETVFDDQTRRSTFSLSQAGDYDCHKTEPEKKGDRFPVTLWNNGTFITHPLMGPEFTDYSFVQDTSLGMSTFGMGVQRSANNSIADDFTVSGNWSIDHIVFYAYQTGSGPPSTITGVYVQVYDEDPSTGSWPIFGDFTTNVLESTEWTGAFRLKESDVNQDRPVMRVVADVSGLFLNSGVYWVEFSVDGMGASGPWAPPVTIMGQDSTGNALKNYDGLWAPMEDVGPQGIPFRIEGYTTPQLDIALEEISKPQTGYGLTNSEDISVLLSNDWLNAQTHYNIPIETYFNGPTGWGMFHDTIPGPLLPDSTLEATLSQTVDFSEPGDYAIQVSAMLPDDWVIYNNTQTKFITHFEDAPNIEVEPLEIFEIHTNTSQVSTQNLHVINTGVEPLNWDLDYDEPAWLSLEPTSGNTTPGDTSIVTLTFDSEGLLQGQFQDTIGITSNDPDFPLIEIPVQLEVLQSLQPPTNLTAEHLGLGVVELNWEFDPTEEFQHFNIYRNSELIASVSDTSYMDSLPVFSIYAYEVTAFYAEGESQPAGPVEIEWVALPIIEVSPMEINETHLCSSLTTSQTLTISNVGEVPLDWELVFDSTDFFGKKALSVEKKEKALTENHNINNNKLDNDVGVFLINQPQNGWGLSNNEPIKITLKNYGNNSQTEIPYEVSWEGPTGIGSINGVFFGNLSSGDTTSITLAETVNLYVGGQYLFEACTYLNNDQKIDNDCETRQVYNDVDNNLPWYSLYSSGCTWGDGLISWNLKNVSVPEIPCEGTPEWYHDYKNKVHLVAPGETYMLTVIAGYSQTYFDVWINYNNDWFATDDELVLNDGYCEQANQEYTFEISIPDTVPTGFHILRYRTNWTAPVLHFWETYTYGNCCDFMVYVSDEIEWLEADTLSGIIEPWESQEVTLTFNSEGLDPGSYFTNLVIQNTDPLNPVVEIPVQLEVQDAEISYTWEPEYFEFEFFITEDPGIDYLTVENTGTDTLLVDFEIEYLDPAEEEWLSINPPIANIPAGEEQIFEVSADPSYFYGYHGEANLIMNTSDVCFPSQTIPVTIDVIGAVDEIGEIQIKIFPNPTDKTLHITAEFKLEKVMLQNYFGQVLSEKEPDTKSIHLDVSDLPGGVYFVTIIQNSRQTFHKVVIR